MARKVKINIYFKNKVKKGYSILVASAAVMLLALPAAANDGEESAVSVYESDPSTIQDTDYVGELVPESLVASTDGAIVTTENTNTGNANTPQEITNEDDAIGEMIVVTPGLASIDANNSPHAADPSLAQANDYIGEMVVTMSVEGSENPNDDPNVDDPSKIQGDDYIGEMVVIVPSQDSSAIVAYDGNTVGPVATPQEVQEDDAIGEMVIIANHATSTSAPSSAIDENAGLQAYQTSGLIFLPLINN